MFHSQGWAIGLLPKEVVVLIGRDQSVYLIRSTGLEVEHLIDAKAIGTLGRSDKFLSKHRQCANGIASRTIEILKDAG